MILATKYRRFPRTSYYDVNKFYNEWVDVNKMHLDNLYHIYKYISNNSSKALKSDITEEEFFSFVFENSTKIIDY